MADIANTPRADHPNDTITSVTDCILGLKPAIDDDELPGFTSLIDDWFSPDVDVDQEQFVQRFLRVFKSSEKDFTYEAVLGDYDKDIQSIFNDFVDGKINAAEAGQRYHPFTVQKIPQNKGIFRKGGLASVVPGERNIFEDQLNLLAATPTSIPSRIRQLIVKIVPGLKDAKNALYVPVSPTGVPFPDFQN